MVNTKIIATLGPASTSRECLTKMFDAGLDVCRLNFSHGDHDTHRAALELIRSVAAERNDPICVIGDLGGPKIRLGSVPDGPLTIELGQTVRFVRGDGPCTGERLTVNYPGFLDDVDVGQRVYIDDGLVRLIVTERASDELVCQCLAAGEIATRKGVNLPDTRLSIPALTEKDHEDLDWAIRNELEYVALSFVREPEDLYELKRIIKQRNADVRVIAKIEKSEALEHLDELIGASDAILVARGDLGVEMDLWRVPLVQKDIVSRCQAAGTPVIVATQMLQSMVANRMPTRAEVSDVANAIFERADAVMLSGETAVGEHPIQAVEIMNRIADATGNYLAQRPPPEPNEATRAVQVRPTAAVAHAAVHAARDLGARAVAVWTATGVTVRMVAKHRLAMPVVGLTYSERVCRQMNLLYGVTPICVQPMDDPAKMADVLDDVLLERELALPGDLVVVVTSRRPHTPGATDTTLVHRIGARPNG